MLKTIIIDDDEIAIFVLINLLNKLESFEIQIAGTATNLVDGFGLIRNTYPDLVILDINMPGNSGLEIFNEFKNPHFKIIFCTAFQQYAIDVLRIQSCGYLLKPVDFMELREAIQKACVELSLEEKQMQLEEKLNFLSTPEMQGENVIFDTENGFLMFNTRNIEYCYANQSYCYIVTYTKKEILIAKSLKEIQDMLPDRQFYRTHKSYLVNIYYIRKYVHARESFVILKSGDKIPVSVRVASNISKDIIQKMKN
jgi:two-component system, LytTR family, response regulator